MCDGVVGICYSICDMLYTGDKKYIFRSICSSESHPAYWIRADLLTVVSVLLLCLSIQESNGDSVPITFLAISLAFEIICLFQSVKNTFKESERYASIRREFRNADADSDGMLTIEEVKGLDQAGLATLIDDFDSTTKNNGIRFEDLKWKAYEFDVHVKIHLLQLFSGVFSFCGALLIFKLGDKPVDNISYFQAVWSALDISVLLVGFTDRYGNRYKKRPCVIPCIICCITLPLVSVVFLFGALSYIILGVTFKYRYEHLNGTISQEEIENSRIPAFSITGFYIFYICFYIVTIVVVFWILRLFGCVTPRKNSGTLRLAENQSVFSSLQLPKTSAISFPTISLPLKN